MSWTTYPIGRPQRVCAATGRELVPGEHSVATLVENPQTGLVERRDFSPQAWNAVPRPVPRRQLLASWKVTVPATDEKPRPILDDDAMLDLFEQLGASDFAPSAEEGDAPKPSSARAALRLVLALMMIRRRLLTHESNKGTTLLVRPRGVPRPQAGGPPLIEVTDPGLDSSTINDVLSELESLGVADAPASPPSPVSPPRCEQRMKRLVLVPFTAALLGLAACSPTKAPEPGMPAPGNTIPGPPYAEVAAKYNANTANLHQLFAPVTVRLQYDDKNGARHEEQGDGRLQIVQPDHVAMSVGKVGETFFWLGSDSQRYWWFDLSGKPRAMFVGVHENYEKSQARRVGAVVAPLDLVRLLGIMPLPESEKGGQTQMSADGRSIGVTTQLEGGGRQRTWITWVEPGTYLPTKIELYNTRGECELVSELSEPDGVDVKGTAFRPQVNKRIKIAHASSRSLITLDLSDMQDGVGRMVPEAFDPAVLAKQLRAEKIYDLDAPPKSPPPSGSSPTGSTPAPSPSPVPDAARPLP
jgi:hypothetical protein